MSAHSDLPVSGTKTMRTWDGDLKSAIAYARSQTPIAMAMVEAALRGAEQALEPFAHFARQWNRQPMRGIDDVIYAIHIGTEYEAAVKLSDMQRAATVLASRSGAKFTPESARRGAEQREQALRSAVRELYHELPFNHRHHFGNDPEAFIAKRLESVASRSPQSETRDETEPL